MNNCMIDYDSPRWLFNNIGNLPGSFKSSRIIRHTDNKWYLAFKFKNIVTNKEKVDFICNTIEEEWRKFI